MTTPSFSSRPGKLISYKTKRVYEFDHHNDRDGAKRRAAESQLRADDAQYTQAMASRAGRDVSARELMAGAPKVPDLRSVRQQVEQDSHLTAVPPDANDNPWAGALQSARNMIARLPADRNRKAARIAMYEAKYAEWETSRVRAREHAEILSRPDVVQAVEQASKRVDSLLMDGTASQAEIDAAKHRLASLQTSGDVATYQADTHAADAAKLASLREQRQQAEATLADLREQVLAGEVSLSQLPTPAAVAPAAEPQAPSTPAARLMV